MVNIPTTPLSYVGERPLNGQAAVVTGSTRNLGLAIAARLAGLGANIVVNYHDEARSEEAEKAADELRAYNTQVLVERADVTHVDDVQAAI